MKARAARRPRLHRRPRQVQGREQRPDQRPAAHLPGRLGQAQRHLADGPLALGPDAAAGAPAPPAPPRRRRPRSRSRHGCRPPRPRRGRLSTASLSIAVMTACTRPSQNRNASVGDDQRGRVDRPDAAAQVQRQSGDARFERAVAGEPQQHRGQDVALAERLDVTRRRRRGSRSGRGWTRRRTRRPRPAPLRRAGCGRSPPPAAATGGSRLRMLRRVNWIATLLPKRPKLTKLKAIEPSDSRMRSARPMRRPTSTCRSVPREGTQRERAGAAARARTAPARRGAPARRRRRDRRGPR